MGKILIASTSLHLIDSLIIKNQFKDEFYIVYIGKQNGFFDLIKNDFAGYLHLEERKDKKKVPLRIENAKKLLSYIKDLNPEEIIFGNDRKIETSILIANYKGEYSYMDDGLHSYIPEKQHVLKYTWFEKKIKEFIYKNRLILPKFIGAGEYAKKAYLFRPDLANEYLKTKELIKLKPDIVKLRGYFINFVPSEWQKELQNAKKVIFLPHPKFITRDLLKKLDKLIDEKTLVKKHPRDNQTQLNARFIPGEVFSEAVFAFLNDTCEVYGYKTTAILTGKWLREELNVYQIYSDDLSKFNIQIWKG